MRPALSRAVLLSLLLLSSSWVYGYSLKKIAVTGSARIPEAEIVKATGLTAGANVTAEDLKDAANHLTESGVFSQVSYKFDGETAEYMVVDAEQFVPATLENFVWFSDAELISRIHNRVPLFTGTIPMTGNLADEVSAELDSILKTKGIPGHTVAAPVPATGQPQAIQFRLTGLNVQIAEVRFQGAAADRIPLLQTATKNLIGTPYLKTPIAGQLRQACLRVYGKLGFLKAQFGEPEPSVVNENPTQPTVALRITVQEGDPYSFLGMDWTGNNAITTAELVKLVDLKPGDEAYSVRLATDIAAAKLLYGSRGYMDPQIRSSATLDPATHTAVFHLALQEGSRYHMGKLDLQNLDTQQADLVRSVWELHEGDVYDASYAKDFLKKHPHELKALNGWGAAYTQTVHDDTLVVDLTLKFQKLEQTR